MNSRKYGKGILSKKKGLAIAISLIAIAGSLFFIDNAKASTDPLPIIGTVYDTTGSPVAGATVIIRDTVTGAWGMNVTNATGRYSITLGGLARPWTTWYDGDWIVGTATLGGQTGKNATNIDQDYYNSTGHNWLNITLGTPETIKTIGEPQFTKYDYNDSSSNYGYLVSEPIHIDGPTATLSFWTWWQIESWDPDFYDLMNVSVSTDGGYTWTLVDTLNPNSAPAEASDGAFYGSAGFNVEPQWVHMTYDLSSYVGQNVTLMFEFNTIDNFSNDWEGWYIDDISLAGFSDNVESGTGNWTYTGYWHITDHRSYSGSHSWYYGIEKSYVSNETEFNMTATGNYNNITYRIWWNGTWSSWQNYTGNFTLGDNECKHYLEFYAENGTNSEPIRNQTHYVDMSYPESTYEFGGLTANLTYNGYNYTAIKSGTPLWINATDDVGAGCFAGVEWLNYSVWWNSTAPNNYEQLYEVSVHDNDANDTDKRVGFISVKIIFNEECFHEIKWQMVDYLGHESPQHSIDISVDTTAPTIVEQVGEPKYVDGNGRTWVNCTTPFWFNITDSGCGGGVGVWKFGINVYWNETQVPPGQEQLFDLIRTIVVTDGGPLDLDGEKNGKITYKFNFSENCFHEPEIWAMDYVGNLYTYKEKYLVDCTPPGIEKRIPKIVAYEQTDDGSHIDVRIYNPYSQFGVDWIDNNQSFIAPWSYIDAISVKLVGSGDVMTWTNETWLELYDEDGLVASSEKIWINDSIDGWLQFHFPDRVYTEHNKTYWLTVKSYADIAWYYNKSNPYPYGNATVDGVTNDSWDFTFKIEYYPFYPYVYPGQYTYINETVYIDDLNATWITSQAFFNLSSWDEGCMGGVGLASLQYRVWWNGSWSEWMNYTEPFNLPDECKHYIEIKAVDLLGNTRIINQTHYVDNSPPVLRVEYPDVHGFYYDEETGKQYVRAGKTFYLNLTDMPDNECAVGWHNFTFYWRYEYTNFTTPYIEEHPANASDTEYPGELVYINGNWWWRINVTGEPSIALSFDRECQHTIYYFYNATDWLDNEVHSGVQEEVIYVDENGPVIEKEHPPCYYDEPWIYLHPDNWFIESSPWKVPELDEWIAYYNWTQLYPDDEFGREYEGTYHPKFDSYIDSNNNDIADDGDYIELVDTQYGVHRLYLIENLTVTMEIYNETLNETKYVEFTGYYNGTWTSDFGVLQWNPFGSLWHEVYPTFSNMYNLTNSSDPLGIGTEITLNDTTTGVEYNWTIENATWDLILDPVPFIQKCARINLTAHDTPEILKLVDQFQNTGSRADELQLRDEILQWPWDAQAFKVSENVSAVNEVWLWLDWDAPANVTIYLHDNTSFTPGNELGEVTVALTGNSTGSWVKFVFDTPVAVTPGETYIIEAFRENGSMVHWYHADSDVYPDGIPYISSGQSVGDWKFAVVAYRPNPCASGIEGIYYGYEFNGTFHPNSMDDNVSTYGQVINISQYYSDEEIRTNFSGHYLWYVYNDSIGVHFHEECIHWLYYWTKDNVCHHTDVHMQVYHVDEYNPVVEKHLEGHGYYTPVSIEVAKVFDNNSGLYSGSFHVRNEWYSISPAILDGWLANPSGQYVDKYQKIDFTITNNDLNKDLHLKLHVKEVVGDEGITLVNGSDVNEKVYTITVPASSTLVYPIYVYDNIEFLRWGVWQWWAEIENVTQYLKAGKKIDLNAYDPGNCASGVENIYYRYVWNNTMYPPAGHPAAVNGSTIEPSVPEIANYWWYIYNDSTDIVFNEECKHDLYYFAKDRICHNSTVHHETYYVDASPPIINETLPEHGAIGNTTQSLFEHFYIPFGNGWAVVNGSTSYWELKSDEPYLDYINHDTYTSHYGYYSAMAWKESGSADSWLITPKVTIPEDGNLSFWYATYYSSSNEAGFEVCVNNMSTQTDTSAFVPVWSSGHFGDTTYRKTEIDLHQYAGQEVYIGFHCNYLEQNYYYGGLLIDDVWIGGIHRIQTLLDDDVEDGADWTVDDLTVNGSQWHQVNRIPVYLMDDPAPSMNCYDWSKAPGYDGFGQYGCNWNDVLKLKNPINLSDANESDDVLLDFMLWHQLGSGDTLYVEVSIDNENWTELASYTGDSGAWLTPSINLSDYIGNATVWIRFRFVSDDSGPTGDAGAFIDNVTIYNSTYTWIYDTFDHPWNNWVASMLPTSMWHIVADSEYHSSNHSWWNGNDSAGTYLSCVDDALISPIYDLSGYSYEKVTLTFWHYREINDGGDYGRLEYRYSNDGSTWTNWYSAATYYSSRDWVQEFVDLNVGHPQKVQFRFRFISDSDTLKSGGWYIDDIHFELRNITETTFEDNFEKTFPPAGWNTSEEGSSMYYRGQWRHYQTPEYTYAAIHAWYNSNQDEWLETPVIHNLPKFSNLTFMHKLGLQTNVHAYLYIKVDNGTWQYLRSFSDTGGSDVIEDISLWSYYGHDIQLAWRFLSQNSGADPYHSYWAIEWVDISSIGFLREGASIHLDVTDQPLNSDCDVGVESIFWRYEENGNYHPGDVNDGYAIISGDRLFELYGEDYNISDIRDYDWYVVNDTTSLNISFGEECVHDLYYFAKDNVCHRTAIHHERYYVDGTAPETWFNISWGNHPWIPRNTEVGEDYWYKPGEGSDWPDVICIKDDVHLYANHYGSEPCIYPYNHQNDTYYRWEWWNPETEQYEWYPTSETPGAINGSSITVSSNADYIQYNDNPSFWHYQTPPDGGYIWWMPYNGSFYFTEGCNHTLFYFSKDDLCNTERPNEWYVGVDDEAPETTLEFNYTDGCIWYNDTYNTWYFQDGTWMGINATDLPNNTYCRTGIWKMEYTVWRWNSSQFDIQIVSNELPGTWTSTPVYIDGSYVGYAYLYVDNDGDGNWSVGDYMYIEWNYGVDYTDGWYRISSMTFDGIFELTVQDVFGGAGDWDVLVPWTTVSPGSIYNTYGGNVHLAWGYNYTWATLWLDVGGLNEYFYPEDSNNNCGKYEVHWRVYDYNNMTVGERKQDVDIDCTPPRTTKEFSQPVREEQISGGEVIHWVNPATTKIWLNGTDDFMWDSGVAETWYKFWEEEPILLWKLNNDTFEQPNYPAVNSTSKNWFTIDEAVQIMGYEDAADYFAHNQNVAESQGIIELYHWSKDRVCHVEDWNESKQHLFVDDMPPTSMVQNITPYQRESVPFNITVVNITDHGYEDSGPVGVCKVELYYSYSRYNTTFGDWTLYATYNVPWDERNNVPNWTLSFDAPEGAGYYHFRSIAYDCVNNMETEPFAWYPEDYDARCLVLADTEPPVVTKEYGSPVVPIDIGGEAGHAITSSTPIWINATDMPEEDWWGVDKIMWNFDGTGWHESPSFNGAHMANYSITPGEFNLTEGVHTIFFKASDMLGHVSDEGKQKFLVDDTPPESYVNDITPYNQSMPVEITGEATDSVGVSEVALYYRYSTDNSTWSDWMLYGTDDTAPYNWSFIITLDPGYYKPGYYQFYSVAIDMLGNQEALPTNATTPDAECYVPPIPSDLNGDGRVNIFDVAMIAQHWGETPESEGWDSSFDLNGDGVINVGDIVVLGQNWTG